MKRFRSEFAYSYTTYSFGYCEYATVESGDVLSEVYAQGFLPYSGTPGIQHTCYMARSARIPLSDLSFSSENRRIANRFDGQFAKEVIPFSDFPTDDDSFRKFCLDYFSKRHGESVLPSARLETILHSGFITHIARYTDKENRVVAYVFLVEDESMSHFWFSFYDLSLAFRSLGMWLMLDCAREAKEKGKRHFYVGTVYGEKALYKTNFDALEFWDGNEWIRDIQKLRALSRKDATHTYEQPDRWKEEHSVF
jgi:arginyl-tRNA--protein-N-Asp/Glu arginylyltransferase